MKEVFDVLKNKQLIKFEFQTLNDVGYGNEYVTIDIIYAYTEEEAVEKRKEQLKIKYNKK